MNYFDLHCDTILSCVDSGIEPGRSGGHISFDKVSGIDNYSQVFAVFMQEKYTGVSAKERYAQCRDYYKNQDLPKGPHIFAIENAGNLITCPEDVLGLRNDGVRVASLSWNAKNPLASGWDSADGLTETGRMAVKELERQGIIPDISHLNDRSCGDLFECAEGTVIATHSNARAICSHKRNLDPWQVDEIARRNGLIGINFYTLFLKDGGNASLLDMMRHIGYFLERGCEKVLAMGSDFDGCDLPDFLRGIEDVGVVYNEIGKCFSVSVADDIFYNNACRFFSEKGVL